MSSPEAPSVKDFFDDDPKKLTLHTDWTLGYEKSSSRFTIVAKVAYDHVANAKFLYLFVPETQALMQDLRTLIGLEEVAECRLGREGDGQAFLGRSFDGPTEWTSGDFVFTKRVWLYVDAELTEEQIVDLTSRAGELGLFLRVRDRNYARRRFEGMKRLAFISYDSRDKEELVDDLALAMMKRMCPVWYDKYSLSVGDPLRESIERGMQETGRWIVVISPNFISNTGWGKEEFDAIFQLNLGGGNMILPIWHNVTKEDVLEYSPMLVNRKALLSPELGSDELSRRLTQIIKRDEAAKNELERKAKNELEWKED